MRRLKILTKGLSPAEIAALKALALDAGFTLDEIVTVENVGEPDPDVDDEIVLVLASPTVCADPQLEPGLVAAQSGGRRAIFVWPAEGASGEELPTSAKKYGYSIICWDADKLRVVAADDDELCFETPEGRPLPAPETERHCTKVEEENP